MPMSQHNGCVVCKDLTRVLNFSTNEYHVARAAPFYRVSTEIAAKMQVDMERAKVALDEHVSSCPSGQLSEPLRAFASVG